MTALAFAGVLATHAAFAHAYPRPRRPPPAALSRPRRSTVAIEFDDELEPAFSAMTVQDAAGKSVDRGPSQVAASDHRHLSVPVQKLAAGTYTVVWHATDIDTHKTSGRYTFTVKP